MDATTEDKSVDTKDSFCEESENVPHKILLNDVTAKLRREIFKLVVGNKEFHKTYSSNNAVAVIPPILHFSCFIHLLS